MRVLFLDVDGVLNRTAYRPVESIGLRSWIEPELARRLSEVIKASAAVIVLISDWRQGRELDELRRELTAAGIDGTLHGVTPVLGSPRWRLGTVMPPHGLLLGLVGAAVLTYAAGAAAIAIARLRRFGTENNPAISTLGRGELAKAHEVFVRWASSRHVTIRRGSSDPARWQGRL